MANKTPDPVADVVDFVYTPPEPIPMPSLDELSEGVNFRHYETTDVDDYEANKCAALQNLDSVAKDVKEAISVALELAKSSNNVNALGKIAELARVYMDTNNTIVDISRKDIEMKEAKAKARSMDENDNGPVLSTKEILRSISKA